MTVIRPREYPHALRNPLMGFRAGTSDAHEWSTLTKCYIPWNAIEDRESEGIEKIRDYCDRRWREEGDRRPPQNPDSARGVEEMNIKVIPRVYLYFPQINEKCWPSDMQTDDYASEQFTTRLLRLIERLGMVWDNDPRVAYVEMGLIGKWGEQHSPSITPQMQKLMGDAFTRAFRNKLVMVRHPWDFQDYPFGIYWDSWAHIQQMPTHGAGIAKLGERWKIAPMGGETAYDWGDYKLQPGESPTDTVKDPQHRQYMIDSIRWLHGNHVGWVANYDQNDAEARRGAEEVQKALGYRFVLDKVRYPSILETGKDFEVSFAVRNTGSSPFYYNWPVELSLLAPNTRRPIWRDTFRGLDIRAWLPGDDWDSERQEYRIKPQAYTAQWRFSLPTDIAPGEYVLALAILDPAEMLPSARFAVTNYFKGGRHPIGLIGVGVAVERAELDEATFDDPAQDRSLHYNLA